VLLSVFIELDLQPDVLLSVFIELDLQPDEMDENVDITDEMDENVDITIFTFMSNIYYASESILSVPCSWGTHSYCVKTRVVIRNYALMS